MVSVDSDNLLILTLFRTVLKCYVTSGIDKEDGGGLAPGVTILGVHQFTIPIEQKRNQQCTKYYWKCVAHCNGLKNDLKHLLKHLF